MTTVSQQDIDQATPTTTLPEAHPHRQRSTANQSATTAHRAGNPRTAAYQSMRSPSPGGA